MMKKRMVDCIKELLIPETHEFGLPRNDVDEALKNAKKLVSYGTLDENFKHKHLETLRSLKKIYKKIYEEKKLEGDNIKFEALEHMVHCHEIALDELYNPFS